MTNDRAMFSTLKSKKGGHVTFGDNSKGKIIGVGSSGKNSSPIIENVLLVEGLKHNLLSINQLYDKDYRVIFVELFFRKLITLLRTPQKTKPYL